jgi:hypothetical protein
MLLTYGSAKTHAHSTFGHRQSQTLKHGCRNSGRSQALFESYVPSSWLADPPRRYKSELLRSSGGGSETGCDRMAILSGRAGPLGWSEVQHRYYEFRQSPNRASLVDCSYPEIMGCSMGHVGSPQPCYTTRKYSHATYRFNRLQMSSPQVQSV